MPVLHWACHVGRTPNAVSCSVSHQEPVQALLALIHVRYMRVTQTQQTHTAGPPERVGSARGGHFGGPPMRGGYGGGFDEPPGGEHASIFPPACLAEMTSFNTVTIQLLATPHPATHRSRGPCHPHGFLHCPRACATTPAHTARRWASQSQPQGLGAWSGGGEERWPPRGPPMDMRGDRGDFHGPPRDGPAYGPPRMGGGLGPSGPRGGPAPAPEPLPFMDGDRPRLKLHPRSVPAAAPAGGAGEGEAADAAAAPSTSNGEAEGVWGLTWNLVTCLLRVAEAWDCRSAG